MYLADGSKLSAIGSDGKGYRYQGSLVYAVNGAVSKLESTPFAGGRITASEGTNGAIYTAMNYVTDHLGSTRVVVNASNGDVSSRNDYYAFGSRWSSGDQAISDNRYLYNGKESQSSADVGYLDYGARMYDPELGRWFNNDPLAEKYYTMSPYVYCANNPIRFIDPDGMDIFRFDEETGEMILEVQTDDDYDQIGKFKYDKETKTYKLKTNRKGKAKTKIDKIEKNILSDGMNFKDEANVWETGGAGQPTIEGFQDFAIEFSDMIGREVAGFYFTMNGEGNLSYIHMGKYENNRWDKSFSTPGVYNVRPDLSGKLSVHTSWHTHPSNAPDEDRLRPSGLFILGGDIEHRENHLKQGVEKFIILTKGHSPIDYTTWK